LRAHGANLLAAASTLRVLDTTTTRVRFLWTKRKFAPAQGKFAPAQGKFAG
jgi:hypothetical protein